MRTIRIGIDIGGTFTDFTVHDTDTQLLTTFKLLSTPTNPADAVIQGLLKAGLLPPPKDTYLEIMHGSTVATNALLERKGARVALVTTAGFKDIIQIGRQNRPELYNLQVVIPPPLVPADLRLEVNERISAEGKVIQALHPEDVTRLVKKVLDSKVESAAVCLLFSFLYPGHELIIATALRQMGLFVSVSHEILPEYREYERLSTTVVNAYVSPVMQQYLGSLEESLTVYAGNSGVKLRVMQSNGGVITIQEARRNGIRCILSGPAGGVVGARFIGSLAENLGLGSEPTRVKLITFDMGGTSTDVALVDGSLSLTSESTISGLPIRIPILDIHTIGAGGGSIASADIGGAMKVGPESAGADPGPACYRSPDEKPARPAYATVTDANYLLGRLGSDALLGGSLPLHRRRAEQAVQSLGNELGLDIYQTALGIVEIANAHMERALRVISVERGHDPRDFTLLSFGGAGGLHASALARGLGIPRVLFPPHASVLSALGMLAAKTIKDFSLTVMLPDSTTNEEIKRVFSPLLARAREEMLAEGISIADQNVQYSLDMRYTGQSYELEIPWLGLLDDFLASFHQQHQASYGYANSATKVEIVNLRIRISGPEPGLLLPDRSTDVESNVSPSPFQLREVYFRAQDNTPRPHMIPCYDWDVFEPGSKISGPALILRKDTTILLEKGDIGVVDKFLNILVTIG